MKSLVLTQPIEGIGRKLPLPEEFEAQIGWVRQQLGANRLRVSRGEPCGGYRQCRVSRGFGAALYGTMPLVELTNRQVEALASLFDQMQRVLESSRKYHLRKS